MPFQLFLPGFPEGSIKIGNSLSILKKEGRVTYFVGNDNYFSHREGDTRGHKFVLASLIENGHVRPCDLEKLPLCIAHRTLMNWVSQLREEGADSFYLPRRHHSAPVMTPAKIAECGRLFAADMSVAAVAQCAGIEESTLRKAMQRGIVPPLVEGPAGKSVLAASTSKAERSRADAAAAAVMGTACTRVDERVAATMGLNARRRVLNTPDVVLRLLGPPALCDKLAGAASAQPICQGFIVVHIIDGLTALMDPSSEGLRHLPPANRESDRSLTACPRCARCGKSR